VILTIEDFGQLFGSFKTSAVRIEALDQYLVEGEETHFRAYLDGQLLPEDLNEEWRENISKLVADGKYVGRVHVVSRQITPYVRFETEWYYVHSVSSGEDIRIAFREDLDLGTLSDTWIFDDSFVVDINYDADGHLLFINRNDDPDRLRDALATWESVKNASISLQEFLRLMRNAPLRLD
jgi:hypothetical protein